jgi:hypothetical protein
MINEIPVFRLELRGLGGVLSTAFAKRAEELSETASQIVKEEIENFDLVSEVRRLVKPALEKAVQRAMDEYFVYGDGAAAIRELCKKAFKESL